MSAPRKKSRPHDAQRPTAGRSTSPCSSDRSREPRRIAEVMIDLLAQRGYAQVQAAEECQAAWQKIAGNLGPSTAPGPLKRGVLQINVRSSIVMQELTFNKSRLLKAIKEELPHHRINDLRFRVDGH